MNCPGAEHDTEGSEISPPAAGLRCRIAQELREEHEAILAMRSIAL